MSFASFELGAGILIAFLALRDVFETVIVPGGTRGGLRIARRLVDLLRPVWIGLRHRQGVSTSFGPLILVMSFALWMLLLAFAFGLMAHALAGSFDPPLPSFSQAVYLVGSGLVTIGLSETDAIGGARWVVLASGFCGLGVMTMAVTYLMEVQTSIAERDSAILKLQTSAGDPPCAVALLEKYAIIGAIGDLPDVLKAGRDWCAAVRQSHLAHPSLIYFRTLGTGAGWPATLGALLDLALIAEHCLDIAELRGRAILLREDGTRLAQELVALLRIGGLVIKQDEGAAETICERLSGFGYALQAARPGSDFSREYEQYASLVGALATHLGRPTAALFPPPETLSKLG